LGLKVGIGEKKPENININLLKKNQVFYKVAGCNNRNQMRNKERH